MANQVYDWLVLLPGVAINKVLLLGYNVPCYEYLYHDGSHFALKMRVVDHVFDEQVVDHLTLKIILPEGAK